MTQSSHNQRATEGNTRRAVLALGLLFASGACAAVSIPAVLLLGPALLLFFVLSLGYFPGEKFIERVGSWRGRTRIAAVLSIDPAPESLDIVARAGLQIAYGLAVRPPPHFSACHI